METSSRGWVRVRTLVGLAAELSRLGADRRASAKVSLVTLLMPLKRRLPGVRDRPIELRLRTCGKPILCKVAHRCDLWVVREVLGLRAYEMHAVEEPQVILDLGSNIGVSVLYFRARYPNARIHAVEPDPKAFELLEANTRGLPHVSVHRLAVADHDGEALFFPASESFASSLRHDASVAATRVEARKLDTLMKELSLERIDLLKVDIEGAEHDVFAASRQLDRIRTILGEVHVDLMPVTYADFMELLEGFDARAERQHIPSMPEAERYELVARNRMALAASSAAR